MMFAHFRGIVLVLLSFIGVSVAVFSCSTVTTATRRDCYTTSNSNANSATCVTDGCFWCPLPSGTSGPWCIQNPICATTSTFDCFPQSTSGVTGSSCQGLACNWCPNVNNNPWCTFTQATDSRCTTIARVDCFTPGNLAATRAQCDAQAGCIYCPTLSTTIPRCIRIPAITTTAAPTTPVATTAAATTAAATTAAATTAAATTAAATTAAVATTSIAATTPTPINQCTQTSPTDCFPTGTATNQQACENQGCTWCLNHPSGIFCVKAQICSSTRFDCFRLPVSTATVSNCQSFGCTWCPMVTGPACVYPEQANAACEATNPVDCFSTPQSGVNRVTCIAQPGCVYCPTLTASRPHCIRVSGNSASTVATATTASVPRTCATLPKVDCYWTTTSQASQTNCEMSPNQCKWCPSTVAGEPWCVENCPVGQTLRYQQMDLCCVGQPASRIVGGTPSILGRWPWIGSLRENGGHTCGVSLISPTQAVTAAHCLDGESATTPLGLTVGFGSILRTSPTTVATVTSFVRHPSYVQGLFNQDVAILTISPAITGGTTNIDFANMPRTEVVPVGTHCFVAGWGDTTSGGVGSTTLLETEVDILDFQQCTTAYASTAQVTTSAAEQICAGKAAGGADSCQGDSGGPLMCQRCSSCAWYIAGLVSFGTGCGSASFPGVYVRGTWFETFLAANGVPPRPTGSFTCP